MVKKKVVIWDLDNTIWNGILSEDKDVVLRDGIREIIEELDKRGILQSIASKNNYDDAMEKLKEFQLDYFFIYPMINWNAKSSNVEYIVKSINVAMDTIAFIDDQIFERDEVSARFPEVTCLDIDEIDHLLLRWDMNPQFLTEDSKIRRTLYQNDIRRKEVEEQFEGTAQEFLQSLHMVMTYQKARVEDLQRAEELTVRTHQLNSTGYTYSYDELKSFIEDDHYELSVVDLKDKYGYYGKIGIVLVEKTDDVWTLKLLLTSCRVMNRGVGTALLGLLINRAIENHVILKAEYVPTDRNRIMAITYSMNGFHVESEDSQKQVLRFMKEEKVVLPQYIEIVVEEERVKMKKEFYDFMCKTLNELTGKEQKYDTKTDLTVYEINSLSFIKIIVAIEDKYGFEFDDEYYTLDRMSTIDAIYSVAQRYVENL